MGLTGLLVRLRSALIMALTLDSGPVQAGLPPA